jgi:hypothetical protein
MVAVGIEKNTPRSLGIDAARFEARIQVSNRQANYDCNSYTHIGNFSSQFKVAAQRVGQLHLARALAFRLH